MESEDISDLDKERKVSCRSVRVQSMGYESKDIFESNLEVPFHDLSGDENDEK